MENLWRCLMYPLVMANITMENGPVEIVSFPMKHGGSFHSYDNLPEGRKDQIPWICLPVAK